MRGIDQLLELRPQLLQLLVFGFHLFLLGRDEILELLDVFRGGGRFGGHSFFLSSLSLRRDSN